MKLSHLLETQLPCESAFNSGSLVGLESRYHLHNDLLQPCLLVFMPCPLPRGQLLPARYLLSSLLLALMEASCHMVSCSWERPTWQQTTIHKTLRLSMQQPSRSQVLPTSVRMTLDDRSPLARACKGPWPRGPVELCLDSRPTETGAIHECCFTLWGNLLCSSRQVTVSSI